MNYAIAANILAKYIPSNLLIDTPIPTSPSHKLQHSVYILKIEVNDTILYKIGMTRSVFKRVLSLRAVNKPSSAIRFKGITPKISVLAVAKLDTHTEAYIYEHYLLDKYKQYKYTGNPVLPTGNTELFTTNILLEIQEGR